MYKEVDKAARKSFDGFELKVTQAEWIHETESEDSMCCRKNGHMGYNLADGRIRVADDKTNLRARRNFGGASLQSLDTTGIIVTEDVAVERIFDRQSEEGRRENNFGGIFETGMTCARE